MQSPDPEIRDTAALATGNVTNELAKNGEPTHAPIAALEANLNAAETLDEQETALAALGNAGDSYGLDVMQPYLDSEHPSIRAQALRSLRFVPDPAVDTHLAGVLQGFATTDAAEPEAAVFAARWRKLDDLFPSLSEAVLGSESESVRGAVLGLLVDRQGEHGGIGDLLATIASSDPSSELRANAQQALQTTLIPTPKSDG